MSKALAGAREARALLDVATRESDPDRVGDELDAVADAMRTQPDVQRLLWKGAVATARKVEGVDAVARAFGLTPLVSKLLRMLAEHERLRLVPALAAAYRARLLERQNIVPAEIVTAVPLGADASERVARALSQVTGKRVLVSARVDASIIGGVIARVGGTVYDGSVTTQLARMRQKLVENV
jgi:F-type H+-transporting ATPase subunit delta